MIDASIDAGADYVGLVLYERSPRNVTPAEALRLARHARGRARVVVLTVDPTDAQIKAIADGIAPDLIQLHGHETVARVAAIGQRAGIPLIKAIGVSSADDVARAGDYLAATSRLMFDAKPAAGGGAALPGGNGLAFDWHALSAWRGGWYMLAGGLTPANVAAAVRLTGAPAVDVSSGVESSPGVKDPALIRDFVAAARSAT